MTYSLVEGFRGLWLPGNESRSLVDLPLLIIAGTDDPIGGRTRTIQKLSSTRYVQGHRALSSWIVGWRGASTMYERRARGSP